MSNRPTLEECQHILENKLKDLKENIEDKKLYFVSTFSITLDESPKVEDINHDPRREEEFMNSALKGVIKCRDLMNELKINYQRPPDMFVEMIKNEKEMDLIRDKLQKDVQNIQKAQAKHKQEKETYSKPKEVKQKRPGLLMKPKYSMKQKKK